MVLCIDIGGTAVKLGLATREGEILARHEASVCFDGYATPILTTVLAEGQAFLAREGAAGRWLIWSALPVGAPFDWNTCHKRNDLAAAMCRRARGENE